MADLFVCLVQAQTGFGKFLRRLGSYPYTHVSLCLSPELTDFVTYARKNHYTPLDAGFMHEYRDFYAFADDMQGVQMRIHRIPLSASAEQQVRAFIHACETDVNQRFNLFSMLTMPLLHGFRIAGTHNCMSFAARAVELSGAVTMDRPYWKYNLQELDALLTSYFYFEGELERLPSPCHGAYMQRPPFFRTLLRAIGSILQLLKRCLFDRNQLGDT